MSIALQEVGLQNGGCLTLFGGMVSPSNYDCCLSMIVQKTLLFLMGVVRTENWESLILLCLTAEETFMAILATLLECV